MPEVLKIPIVSGGNPFRETILIDEEEFIFEFNWNQYDSAWYLVLFKDGSRLSQRLRLVSGYNLLDAVLSIDKPAGALYLYDIDLKTSVGRDIENIDELGNRILLVYEPE